MSRTASIHERSRFWGRWRIALAPLAILALVVTVVQGAPTPAHAAGSGVLTITPTIVNPSTGAVMATVDPAVVTQYRVDYSFTCGTADCNSTTVSVAPNPKDPYYNQFVLESAGYTFTPPFPGATATGSPAAGITVNLGNLTAGSSGVFQIYYTTRNNPGLPTPGSPGSFFPDGWVIPASATIQSPTAVAPASGSTSATWVSRTKAPTFATGAPASTRTDTAITISAAANSGCNYFSGYNYGTEVYQCAKSFTMSTVLPVGAQYVAGSASGGGVYDAPTRTVTWAGADTTSATSLARGPFARTFQVTFPSAGMPTTGAGCVAPQTFTSNLTLVLLDGTVQTPAATSATVQAQNCDPFSGMTTPVKTSTASSGNIVYIPNTGTNNRFWTVTAGNTANVAGVATITDTALDQPDMPVYSIYNPGAATMTVDYVIKDSAGATTTGTTTLAYNQSFGAPAGKRFVSATATSGSLIGPNASPASQTAHTDASISFYYSVGPSATPGNRTNTASVTMSYPGYSLTPLTGTATKTVTLQATPSSPPSINVAGGGPTVTPAGNIVAGSTVTWSVSASVTSAPNNNSIRPQYVFLAPYNWNITGSSWQFAPPAGTTVVQSQVTIAGQVRNIVVATWQDPLTIGPTGNAAALPQLYVTTSPTAAAPAGINTATMLFGDANHGTSTFSPATPYTEPVDFGGDGTTGDLYAKATVNANVTGTPALSVLKEICRPDGSGGCIWIANSNALVGVPPAAGSIKYRITITNTGSAQANNIVAYDVLPYLGDTGTTTATASAPRGSTVKETLNAVNGVPSDVALAYSTSTNPPRTEVYSGSTTGTWTAPVSGASSLRATITALAAGASRTFTYDAALIGGTADKIACNSVAAAATSLSAVEPAPVCATTQEADLSVTSGSRFPLQVGRIGTLPFVVNNGGGSQLATGTVTLAVPSGLTVNSFTVSGWACTAPSMTGPVTVTCNPIDTNGNTRQLLLNTPETIPLVVTPSAALVGAQACVAASITGIMSDPDLTNNDANVCSTVVAATPLLSVTKTDGVTAATPGQTLTYTITAANGIVDQGLTGVAITDVLPANVAWVSGGTVTGQDSNGLGGTVTFAPTDFTAAGTSTTAGNGTSNAGSSTTFTLKVRVATAATGAIVNNVTAKATDPLTTLQLTATDGDTDQLQRLTVTKASNAVAAGVRTGDAVTYTVTLRNDGTAAYTAGNPASVLDDLTGVLDDATYVSGTAKVDSGAPSPISPNGAKHIVWSGALPVGSVVTIVYSVTIGSGGNHTVTNTAYASGQVESSCVSGVDPNGISCATVTSVFAPTINKHIQSQVQNDDGTWTIVYAVDVTNPSAAPSAPYNLSDTLKFGAGITATATAAGPAGVTLATPAWSGAGATTAVATGAVVPANSVQTYTLTVIADAHQVAGTPAATCVRGTAGGFANQATLSLAGIPNVTSEACASPVKPTIQKSVGAPVQQSDGSWNVVYTVTVTNSNTAPADLAYTVKDAFAFAPGATVNSVQVSGPGASATFNGGTDQVLLSGVGRVPASSTRVYTVTVNATANVGAVTPANLLCSTPGGGYGNTATLFAGTSATTQGSASACASVTVAPLPVITKKVVSSAVDTFGNWTLIYQIDVQNPDATYNTFYDLSDALKFASPVNVISATVTSAPASVTTNPNWDGIATAGGDTSIVQSQPLPAGQTDSYQVTVVADPTAALDPESAAADCLVDAGENGQTGFRNVATVTAGVKSAIAEACEPATDPSVVKTVAQAPTQNPSTGVWTVKYQLSVSNKSTTTSSPIPYTIEDTLNLPAGIQNVQVTAAAGTGGSAIESDFDGATHPVLVHGTIGAAADASTPAIELYTVTVKFTEPSGISAGVQCDANQGPGGLQNIGYIKVGSRTSGSVACVDLPDVPLPSFTKTVASQKQQADGTWLVDYDLTVTNPSSSAASTYSLTDSLALGAGMTVVSAAVTAAPGGVTTAAGWNGQGSQQLVNDILLPAAGSHTYTVRVVVDSGSLKASDAAADCTLTGAETTTGLSNSATLKSAGTAQTATSACATTYDPGVTKTIDGAPVQQLDGSWLLSYTMTVTNPSNVQLSYGLDDSFNFPTGTTTTVQSATGPGARSDWDGAGQPTLVDDGQALAANAVAVYHVTVSAVLPAGQASDPTGWKNTATVDSGSGGVITTAATSSAAIALPKLEVAKTVIAGPVIRIGDQVNYSVTITNTGAGDFTGLYPAVVWDDMSDVLDDATVSTAPAATPNVGAITTSPTGYNWRGALASGGSVTVDYAVDAKRGGNASLANIAFTAAPDVTAPTTPAAASCASPDCASTLTAMPALLVQKHVEELLTTPSGAVHYTVTVTNTGKADIPSGSPAIVTDDLSGVLSNATYAGDAVASTGSVTITNTTLTWTGGLNAGQTATITYSAKVASNAPIGTKLVNLVTADPTLATLGLAGAAAPATVTTTSIVSLLAFTGTTLTALLIGSSVLLVGILALLFAVWRRRRRDDEPELAAIEM